MTGGARGRYGASTQRGPRHSPVARVLLAQWGLAAVLAAVFWGFAGRVSAYSALLGALTAAIPNTFLALRLLVPRRDPAAGALLRAAYLGELGKLALTVLMFTAVFVLVRPLSAPALFTGFIAAQLVVFAGLLMRDNEQLGKAGKAGIRNGD